MTNEYELEALKKSNSKVLEQSALVSASFSRPPPPPLPKPWQLENIIIIQMIMSAIGNGSIFNAIPKAKVALWLHPIFASNDDQRKKGQWS